MVIRAVFFDFDGTILDTHAIALRSFFRVFEELGFEVDEKKVLDLLGIRMEEMLEELGIEVGNARKIRRKFYKHFTDVVLDEDIELCCDLGPLLEMKSEGLPMFVVSNSRTSFLRAAVKRLGIRGLFKGLYGSEKFDSKEEMLVRLFGKLGIKASEAVYVGDRFSDVECAKRARCVAVAIHNRCSFSALDRIKEERPDFIVRDFGGLRRIIKKINNSSGGLEK